MKNMKKEAAPKETWDRHHLEVNLELFQNKIEHPDDFLKLILESIPNPLYVIDASDYSIRLSNSAARFGKVSPSMKCYSLTHRRDKPCSSENHPCPLETIKKTRRPVIVEHIHYDQEGNPRNIEVYAFPVFDKQGHLSYIIESELDITARKEAQENLEWELSVNSALSDIYKPLSRPGISVRDIAGITLDKAKVLTKSEHGFVSSIDPVTGENLGHADMLNEPCEISSEYKEAVFKRGSNGLYRGLCGHCLNTSRGFFTNRPATHAASVGTPERHVPIQRLLCVPVLLADEPVGQIALANKREGYTDRELEAVERMAQLYALAIQRKRIEDDMRQSYSECERRVDDRTADLVKTYQEKMLIRETFGRYLSDEIASEILAPSEGVKLGGEIREVTVLVSDLRGFTSATESMAPTQIVSIINRHLEIMIDIIVYYEGTIDEFTGDGILVFFGAPRQIPNHSLRAMTCAIEMQQSMNDFNGENTRLGLPQIEMGIGISCGELVVGNIGSEKRRKYGAVGSAINEAFRLVEKARPKEILITQAVRDRIGENVNVGNPWNDNLKGIGNTVIYSVQHIPGACDGE